MTMAGEAELIVDRRRLRRRLVFWRIVGCLAVIIALLALVLGSSGFEGFKKHQDHIARLRVTGMITGDQPTLDLLKELRDSETAKALIIRLDTPGGTTAGSEALYEAIREIAKTRPVVAVMDTIAASGGYITAIAADHIVARGNTITGSIGVIFQWAEVSKLMDTLGVRIDEIKSGDLKAEPSPFKPIPEKARDVSNAMVQDAFRWFTGLVAERRRLPMERVLVLSDGRVYTGRQALTEKLVDDIGGEEKAVDWLVKDKKIASDLEIVDWRVPSDSSSTGLGFSAVKLVLRALGLGSFAGQASGVELDGLLALWHPALQ
ncbi:MAG: signal peptide peptidase SppA [Rhizobiales bacterium]|nr:signal peptide peptidase SppA [Hyphomicrobiales bacterium]